MSKMSPDFTWVDACIEGDALWQEGEGAPDKPLEEWTSEEVGAQGERIAAKSLANRGYEILGRNWVTPLGEADIVCRDGDMAVLVEVKTRVSLTSEPLYPEMAVDEEKLETYRQLSLLYLLAHDEMDSVRLDVVAVSLAKNHVARLRHIVGAFEWDD